MAAVNAVADNLSRLSPRQRQVFNLLMLGYSQKEIADYLGISDSTVDTHKYNTAVKLGLDGTKAMPWNLVRMLLGEAVL